MRGLMMGYPLTLTHFLNRSAGLFANKRIVQRGADGGLSETSWGDFSLGVERLAGALSSWGLESGDRVATLCWNHLTHLELYFAVPCMGAVLHTVNVRLSPDQIAGLLQASGARVLVLDREFLPLLQEIAARVTDVELFLVVGESGPPGEGAAEDSPALYETWVEERGRAFDFPDLDEESAAALCYTSGTTGDPKGVLYSHRALALHTLAICLPDGFGIGEGDVILPAVPMFHANGWGLPFAAAMTGATLVLPGARPTAATLVEMMGELGVTFTAGVPTVWLAVLDELRRRAPDLSSLRAIHAGGAPSPPAMIKAFRDEFGVEVITGWGMTELAPVGMVCHPRAHMSDSDTSTLMDVLTSQGTPLPFVEARIVDEEGAVLPWDGEQAGELRVRGPWVSARYFREETSTSLDREGWLRTGDVATGDPQGYVRLVDRTKDLVRSGGEWISSVRLEGEIMGHPGVAEAAVIAVPHPRWGERPLACVVLRQVGEEVEVLEPLRDSFPDWWIPDDVVFLQALPRTSTGKFDKRALRERFRDRFGGADS